MGASAHRSIIPPPSPLNGVLQQKYLLRGFQLLNPITFLFQVSSTGHSQKALESIQLKSRSGLCSLWISKKSDGLKSSITIWQFCKCAPNAKQPMSSKSPMSENKLKHFFFFGNCPHCDIFKVIKNKNNATAGITTGILHNLTSHY